MVAIPRRWFAFLNGAVWVLSLGASHSFANDYAAAKDYPTYTVENFLELLRSKWSIEEVTAALPEELQTNVTVRLEPRNRLQEGPRAIRFTSDGRLMITHNDDPQKRGGRNIEIAATDENGNRTLLDVAFSADGKSAPVITSNRPSGGDGHGGTQACTACHGTPPRLIYQSYATWKGACGEADDKADEKCLAFLKRAKTNPRFKDLKWDPENPAWPYHNGVQGKGRTLSTSPNARFTLLVQFGNANQFANVVQASPLYEKLKYTLMDQYLCAQPEADMRRFRTLLARSNQVPVPKNWKGTTLDYVEKISDAKADFSGDDDGPTSRAVSRRNFFEFFGVPMGNTGGNEVLRRNGITGIGYDYDVHNTDSISYLATQLLVRESESDPVLRSMVKNPESYVAASEAGYSGYYNGDAKFMRAFKQAGFVKIDAVNSICPHIHARAQAEMRSYEEELNLADAKCKTLGKPTSLQKVHAIADGVQELVLEKGKALLESENCNSCHDPVQGKPVGPRIRFRNPAHFAEDSERMQMEDGMDAVAASERLMSSDVHQLKQMPLSRPPLDPESREALLRYLKSMAYASRPVKK